MTDAEKKPCCCTAEPAEKDTVPSCCRHKDRTPEEYRALANRLSRIEGQLDKDVYCADILVQVAAVNAALNGFSKELLGQHIRTCVADDLKAGETQKLDELLQLLPRLMK
jgi:DNA-binding FrmR family transcriptional regulator